MSESDVNRAVEFLKDRAHSTPWGTVAGLNQLPYVLFRAVAEAMVDFASEEAKRFAPCDQSQAMKALEERVLANSPHPSHVWNNSVLNCCIRCEAFYGQPQALLACDPSKLDGRTEWCCECANEYPRSDLIAGEIYCPACRKKGIV